MRNRVANVGLLMTLLLALTLLPVLSRSVDPLEVVSGKIGYAAYRVTECEWIGYAVAGGMAALLTPKGAALGFAAGGPIGAGVGAFIGGATGAL